AQTAVHRRHARGAPAVVLPGPGADHGPGAGDLPVEAAGAVRHQQEGPELQAERDRALHAERGLDGVMSAISTWAPPEELSKPELVAISNAVLGRADLPLDVREDIFRISVLGMDWDVGGKVYQPVDP